MEPHLLKFERLVIASIALGVVVAAMGMKAMTSNMESAFVIAAFQVLIICIILTLVLFISRRKSNVAKWIWLIFFIGGLALYIPMLGSYIEQGLIGFLSICQLLLQCLGTYFLFFGKEKENQSLD